VWLYGTGFVITTATLYIKMQQMEKVIEHSLQMTSKKIKMDQWQIYRVLICMISGEYVLLLLWAVVAPLEYKRSCVDRVKGGVWGGDCVESLGKCRTTMGQFFVAIVCFYHACCVLAGMYMCYKVRNLPSIMAEGKWVFTGFYSQLQVFVTAVPVLVMVKDDYYSFTILKSLVICVGDLTTLAMVFVPKMLLVRKYGDFNRAAVAEYVSESMSDSTQKDTVYERLREKGKSAEVDETSSSSVGSSAESSDASSNAASTAA